MDNGSLVPPRLLLVNLLLANVVIVGAVTVSIPRGLQATVPIEVLGIAILLLLLSAVLYSLAAYGVYSGLDTYQSLVPAAILLHIVSVTYLFATSPSGFLAATVTVSLLSCCAVWLLYARLRRGS